jgi:hypothetical protein
MAALVFLMNLLKFDSYVILRQAVNYDLLYCWVCVIVGHMVNHVVVVVLSFFGVLEFFMLLKAAVVGG